MPEVVQVELMNHEYTPPCLCSSIAKKMCHPNSGAISLQTVIGFRVEVGGTQGVDIRAWCAGCSSMRRAGQASKALLSLWDRLGIFAFLLPSSLGPFDMLFLLFIPAAAETLPHIHQRH